MGGECSTWRRSGKCILRCSRRVCKKEYSLQVVVVDWDNIRTDLELVNVCVA
jgi:arginyl-tRNA--protein-N-Asp/Glu arginylyltransferase